MHKLLERQLKKHLNSTPLPESLQEFVKAVGEYYEQLDADRMLADRALELSSRELLEANSEMRTMFSAFPDLSFRLDEHGTILDYRGGGSSPSIIPPQKMIGRRIQDVPEKEVGAKFQDALNRLNESHLPVSIEYALKVAGTDCSYEARFLSLPGSQVLVVVRDISERRLAEQLLVKRSRELEETLRKLEQTQEKAMRSERLAAIGRLASGVGHELRNPLGAIRNAVYYIRDAVTGSPLADADPTLIEFLGLVDREILSATRIIDDLLDFSRIPQLLRQPVDANALLTECKSLVETPPNIRIVERFADRLPSASLDGQKIKQVFLNMMQNAIQAMPNGGVLEIMTRFGAGRAGRAQVSVEFKDSGVGIPPEVMAKIFEPLFTTKAKGTGLGLPICAGIVEKHSGSIEVSSEEGKGSRFIVHLPVEEASHG